MVYIDLHDLYFQIAVIITGSWIGTVDVLGFGEVLTNPYLALYECRLGRFAKIAVSPRLYFVISSFMKSA